MIWDNDYCRVWKLPEFAACDQREDDHHRRGFCIGSHTPLFMVHADAVLTYGACYRLPKQKTSMVCILGNTASVLTSLYQTATLTRRNADDHGISRSDCQIVRGTIGSSDECHTHTHVSVSKTNQSLHFIGPFLVRKSSCNIW